MNIKVQIILLSLNILLKFDNKMRKVIIIGSLTAIVIVANFLSCKRDSYTDTPDNSYDCFNDSLFAPLSIAKTIAENVNKSNTI